MHTVVTKGLGIFSYLMQGFAGSPNGQVTLTARFQPRLLEVILQGQVTITVCNFNLDLIKLPRVLVYLFEHTIRPVHIRGQR